MARCFCRWRAVLICVCTPCICLLLLFSYAVVLMVLTLNGIQVKSEVVNSESSVTDSPRFVAPGTFNNGIFSSQPKHFWDHRGHRALWNQLQLRADRHFNPILNLKKTTNQQNFNGLDGSFFENMTLFKTTSNFTKLPEQLQRFVSYMDRRDYPVLLQPGGECGAQAEGENERPLLLFAIKTTEGNFLNRQAIRQSWGREGWVRGQWGNGSGGGEAGGYVRRVFLLGKRDSGEPSAAFSLVLKMESDRYGDMLQWDFHDTFFNLTLKDVLFWRWFSASCGDTAFVFKGDDDVFVNTPKMVAYLLDQLREPQAHKATRDFMVGDVIVGAPPSRDDSSKYFIPENFYRGFYPRYAGGGGVVYSGLLARRLHRVSQRVHLYPIDDVFVGMCMIRLNALPVYHPAFLTFDFPDQEEQEPCSYHKILLVHKRSPDQIRRLWANMTLTRRECGHVPLRVEKKTSGTPSEDALLEIPAVQIPRLPL
ncbi:N-acetyllactosaminide beta-1,3-N-acetylglucosaminyltransferase 2 [Salarias fasciatus]|uniref:N-acetyllactosaminide beta-1,3-N-acetylglucosaminyltransferase 2 n=1 Tax=Salarias fasciatus TaxID=181472 RepID=UPI0011767800|nr:N-acetyllactosaminide beta-1,3-N-acetylglucosaminyltransferase 2-like [Salarias fasciatus]